MDQLVVDPASDTAPAGHAPQLSPDTPPDNSRTADTPPHPDLPQLPLSPEQTFGILESLSIGIMEIFVYFLTPRVLFSHAVAAGLIWQLYRQGASLKEVVPLAVLQEVVTYFLWWLIPNSFATIFAIWFSVYLYETILGPKISVRNNAVFVSGE